MCVQVTCVCDYPGEHSPVYVVSFPRSIICGQWPGVLQDFLQCLFLPQAEGEQS